MRRSIYISGNRKKSEQKSNIPITRKESPTSEYATKKVSVQSPLLYDEKSNEITDIENDPKVTNVEITVQTTTPNHVSEDNNTLSATPNDLISVTPQTESSTETVVTNSNIDNDIASEKRTANDQIAQGNMPQKEATRSEDNYGIVIVIARTASGAIPISNALVTISSVIGDAVTVVASTETGVDGRTLPIPLPSQPISNSSRPGNDMPYSLYNIDTDASGFYGVRNIDVPIYPGITSIQQVELIPLIEGTVRRNGNEIKYNESSAPTL